jgi:hypothetical protein
LPLCALATCAESVAAITKRIVKRRVIRFIKKFPPKSKDKLAVLKIDLPSLSSFASLMVEKCPRSMGLDQLRVLERREQRNSEPVVQIHTWQNLEGY